MCLRKRLGNTIRFFFQREQTRSKFSQDSILYYKEQAIEAANNGEIEEAVFFLENYVKYSADTELVNSRYFKKISSAPAFQALNEKYSLNFDWLKFFYLFTSIVGFFIGIMLLLKRKHDRIATLLISLFVLIHSVFIFHIFLHGTNLKFRTPHVLYMSALTAYLYGPLIYFYFKRITLKYEFRKIDLLHLIPTLLIVVILFPIFMLPAEEKINIMLEVGVVDRRPYLVYIVATKFASLIIYGILVLRVYMKNKNHALLTLNSRKWLVTMVLLVEVYVLSYIIYGFTIIGVIPNIPFLFNFQICVMAFMVLYIGYNSYIRPELFSLQYSRDKEKYKKSALTPSYSVELKTELLRLLEEEHVYRQNDISLAALADMLGTTRHNASQVINENFNLSFFELINKFRIAEAQRLFENEDNDMKIIEVAYEVGFNNKVSFNKSFKKYLSQTPSQYLGALRT